MEHTKIPKILHYLTTAGYSSHVLYPLYGRSEFLIVAINKPVRFIKAIQFGGVVTLGLSKLG